MHELTAMTRLIREAEEVAHAQGAPPAGLTLQVGAISGFTAASLRRVFPDAARGTALEGARLEIRASDDVSDEMAQLVVLLSVDVEA